MYYQFELLLLSVLLPGILSHQQGDKLVSGGKRDVGIRSLEDAVQARKKNTDSPIPEPSMAPTVKEDEAGMDRDTSVPTVSPSLQEANSGAPTTLLPTEVAITAAPSTIAPTSSPPVESTEAPTTFEPSLATDSPSVAITATEAPVTQAPTTPGPTTAMPTTMEPTTIAPTGMPAANENEFWVALADFYIRLFGVLDGNENELTLALEEYLLENMPYKDIETINLMTTKPENNGVGELILKYSGLATFEGDEGPAIADVQRDQMVLLQELGDVQDAIESYFEKKGMQVLDVSSTPFAKATSFPTFSPTSSVRFSSTSPVSAEISPNESGDTKLVVLDDFSILLLSPGVGVNVGELEPTLEKYLYEAMLFGNLKSVSLTIREGSTAIGANGLTSTSIRYSGLASFVGELPILTQIRAEQHNALLAKDDLQMAINRNQALGGARVINVSLSRLSAEEAFVNQRSASGGDGDMEIGVLAGIVVVVSISLLVCIGAMFVLRHKIRTARSPSLETAAPSEACSPSKAQEKVEMAPPTCSNGTMLPPTPAEITFRELDETETDFDDLLTVDTSLRD